MYTNNTTPEIYDGEIHPLLQVSPPRENPQRRIKKLPPHLRLIKTEQIISGDTERVYDPIIMSFGPYNHGKPELVAADDFKRTVFNQLTRGNPHKKHVLYAKVTEVINEIKNCYDDDVSKKYDDRALAAMMLLDACFVVAFVERVGGYDDTDFLGWQRAFGASALRFAIHDMMLLENQIPLPLVKILIGLRHESEGEGEVMISKFLNWMMYGETSVPSGFLQENAGDQKPPLHLLEACRRLVIGRDGIVGRIREITKNCDDSMNEAVNINLPWKSALAPQSANARSSVVRTSTCRSVTDLKAKGVRFRRSRSSSYGDVEFVSGAFYGELQLPSQIVSSNSRVVLSNMIAYEVSSGGGNHKFEVLSYVNFMKSLIQSPADVKELEERGILFNRFHNYEQVVQVFKMVETFGIDNVDIFRGVKWEIEDHCRSRAKTWLADLIHTRFSSPWTAIALLAAIFLLCLTFLQTYFTIHPVK